MDNKERNLLGQNNRGYINSTKHIIKGNIQEVYLEVHPFNDFYYKWIKMRDEYEWRERCKERERQLATE